MRESARTEAYQNRCFDRSQIPKLEPVGTGTHFSGKLVNHDLRRLLPGLPTNRPEPHPEFTGSRGELGGPLLDLTRRYSIA